MKANQKVSLADVRNEWKNVKGTPCQIIKSFYAATEKGCVDVEVLRALLPAKRQDAIDLIPAICEAYNVGGKRVIKLKNGVRESTIKFSADMFLRYLVAKQNEGAHAIEKAAKQARKAKEAAKKAEKKAAKKAEKKAA